MKVGIYIPGLGYGNGPISLTTYAQNFARALDKNDENKLARYTVKFDKVVFDDVDQPQEFNVADIKRLMPGTTEEETLYRFYEYSYEDDFTEEMRNTNIFRKSLKLVWGFGKMTPVFLLSLIKRGQSGKQKLRSLYFFSVLILFSVATALLIPSLVAVLTDNIPMVKQYFLSHMDRHGFCYEAVVKYKDFARILVVVTSAMALLSPKFQNLITIASTEYLCVHYYLKYGEGKQTLIGDFSNLVEKISEKETAYTSFEVHAFSFGSVVAIDALYPSNAQQADLRTSTEITRFVTVGCPVDFIRVYYPNYFSGRKLVCTGIQDWYNVNCEVDVLSSNFRNDNKKEDGDPAVVPGGADVKNITYEVTPYKNVSWVDYLFLLGFKSHKMYWGEGPNGMSFFTNYINRLRADKKF